MPKITYHFVNRSSSSCVVDDVQIQTYQNMNMGRLFVVTDLEGKMKFAFNPAHLVNVVVE